MQRFVDTGPLGALLQEVCGNVRRAAPVYEKRVAKVAEIRNRNLELKRKEAELTNRISEFQEVTLDTLTRVEEAHQQSQERLESVKSQLISAVLREAQVARFHGREPKIKGITHPDGETSLVKQARLQTRVIEMRARLLAKQDRLNELRRKVLCLEEDLDDPCGTAAAQFVRGIQDAMSATEPPLIEDFVNAKVSERISGFLENEVMIDKVDFNVLQFPVRSGARIESVSSVELPKSKVTPGLKEELAQEQRELMEARAARNAILERAKESGDWGDGPFVTFVDLFANSVKQLAETQEMIERAMVALRMNRVIPQEIWAIENRIHDKMKEIVWRMNRLVVRFSEKRLVAELKPFGYAQVTEPLVIEETPAEQLERCRALIEEVEGAFIESQSQQAKALEAVEEQLNQLERASRLRESENSEEAAIPQARPVSDEWREREREFIELNKKLREQQREQIKVITEFIEQFGDEIPRIDYQIPDATVEVRLPRQISVDIDDVAMPRTSCNSILEANDRLIERIQEKSRSFNPAGLKQIAAPAVCEMAVGENPKLANIFSDSLNRLQESANTTDVNSLLHKKAELAERLRVLEVELWRRREKKRQYSEWKRDFADKSAELKQKLEEIRKSASEVSERLNKARKVEPRHQHSLELSQQKYHDLSRLVDELHQKIRRRDKVNQDLARVAEEERKLDEEIARADGTLPTE